MPTVEPLRKLSHTAPASLTAAQRAALSTYRLTSRELKRRTREEVASDPIVKRSLNIGAIGVWCFWVAAAGFVGTGVLVTLIAAFKGLSLLIGIVAIITFAALIASPIFWLIGRITLTFALDARKSIASESVRQNHAYRDVEQIRAEREGHETELFRRNLEHRFVLRALRWNGVRVFDNGEYIFSARVNVLLGKNGYGKTLLFRTLAAIIQRDMEHSAQLFPPSAAPDSDARLIVEVTRNGNLEQIVRDPVYFEDNVGKIPLLAIPDSRFVNKSVETVSSSATGSEPWYESGARHYLTQEPYENVVVELLTQIGIDYIESRKGFDQPIFRLIEGVVRQLTDDDEFRFASIQRVGRTGFQILVFTAGNRDVPVPIQSASQGTFSVIAIFGLIFSFLRSLHPNRSGERDVCETPAIVLIDEIDAHLHPTWQQKLLGILTDRFPQVQFIVSAHSPLIVAGCDFGEVAVLRRDKGRDRFRVHRPSNPDFLGATAKELYKTLFELEETDRLYLEYSVKATMYPPGEGQNEMIALESKKTLSSQEEQRLSELQREQRLIQRAEEVRNQRLDEQKLNAQVARLEDEVKVLRRKLASVTEARQAESQ